DTIDALDATLHNLDVDKNNFYYIADSALFSKKNLDLSSEKDIKLITRIPDSVLMAREGIEEAVNTLDTLEDIEIINAKGKPIPYRLLEKTCIYQEHELKLAVCYSPSLKSSKKRTTDKAVTKEMKRITKISKALSKREFACLE